MAQHNIKIDDFGCIPFCLLGIMVALSFIASSINSLAIAIEHLAK
jgi:hypothetical protein